MQKNNKLIVFLLLLSMFVTGCSNAIGKSSIMPDLIKKTVQATEDAINNNDVELAREIWSQISEYGLKAKEVGEKELSDSLGRLASTYVDLVSYLMTGEEKKLEAFRVNFEQALNNLQDVVEKDDRSKI